MSISQQINERVYQDVVMLWGREPTWGEFKYANKFGNVQVNINVATQLSMVQGTLSFKFIFYMFLLPAVWLLFVPIALVAYSTGFIAGWWVLGTVAVSLIAKCKAMDGQCESTMMFAEVSQQNYKIALRAGALEF